MSQPRLEWKVGVFVLVVLVLAGFLTLKFSKGPSLFADTYDLRLETTDVGGIRTGASVLMAGVKVGYISQLQLDPSGRTVTMVAKIDSPYKIYSNAHFSVQQAGFLGDMYVAVEPASEEEAAAGPPAHVLKPDEAVQCDEPFNIQEVARSGASLLQRFDDMAVRLDEAVSRINRSVLSEETLGNVTAAVDNLRQMSDRGVTTLGGVDSLIATNAPGLSESISNLVVFSEQLNTVAKEFEEIVTTNRVEISSAIKNIDSATLRVDKLLADLQGGSGLAGNLLRNDEVARDFRDVVSNLSNLSSNLNRFGILWKPKTPHPLPNPIYTGRSPFR